MPLLLKFDIPLLLSSEELHLLINHSYQ